jgi:hypothetical protein
MRIPRLLCLFSSLVLVFAGPAFAHAATTFYLEVPTSSIAVGATFPVRILLDSDQPVNAYAVKLSYSSNLLELLGMSSAHSLITVAQDNPVVNTAGTIEWSGGSVKPFVGTRGEILTLTMKATATGTAQFAFYNSQLYLANGKGTKVFPDLRGLKVPIVPPPKTGAPSYRLASGENVDAVPPEITFLSFIDNPFNADQKLLGFSVVDVGSGVKENDIRYRSGVLWSAWQLARNPVPLQTDVWQVDFRAMDNAGNAALITAYDWGAVWSRLVPELALAIGVVLAIYFAMISFMRRRRRTRDRIK